MRIGRCLIEKAAEEQPLHIGTDQDFTLNRAPLEPPVFEGGAYLSFITRDGMIFTEVYNDRLLQEAVLAVRKMGSSFKFTFQLQRQVSMVELQEEGGWMRSRSRRITSPSPRIEGSSAMRSWIHLSLSSG